MESVWPRRDLPQRTLVLQRERNHLLIDFLTLPIHCFRDSHGLDCIQIDNGSLRPAKLTSTMANPLTGQFGPDILNHLIGACRTQILSS
jgi:hypothetical protein